MTVCYKCQRQMRPVKNGIAFIEMAGDEPYKLYMGDLVECQDCGAQMIVGIPPAPLAEHWQPKFKEMVASEDQRHEVIHAKEFQRR